MTTPSQIEYMSMKKLGQMSTFAPNEECRPGDLEEFVATQFDSDFYKNMWYSRADIIVEGTVNDGALADKISTIKRAVFKIDTKNYDILQKSQIIVSFPSIKIKEKYRNNSQDAKIAWTPFPVINYIIDVQLRAGDTTIIDPFDTVWLMNHLVWNTNPGDMDIVNNSIGNKPSMLDWTESIPGQTCYHKLPFGYSYSLSSALPLYLFNSQISLSQVITYHRNPVEKLLMMKITDDGNNWTQIAAQTEMLEISECLPPTIEMSYHKILEREKQRVMERPEIVIPMHNVVSFSGKNKKQIGEADPISITTLHPLLAIFANSRNLKAEELNIRSNYTTNVYSPKDGSSPINNFYMSYDLVTKFNKTSESMSSNDMLSHFINVPQYGGYLAYAYSTRPFSVRYMVGPVINPDIKATLTVQYGKSNNQQERPQQRDDGNETDLIKKLLEKKSKDESKSESQTSASDGNSYITEIRALVFRDLQFVKVKEGVFSFTLI